MNARHSNRRGKQRKEKYCGNRIKRQTTKNMKTLMHEGMRMRSILTMVTLPGTYAALAADPTPDPYRLAADGRPGR